ncbi:MAG: tetratricopeptide repeat protein [Selenomonadaceae bacterium]|nr:tetratricopeptide repeat protein [Selenomonadaceae bacterium]
MKKLLLLIALMFSTFGLLDPTSADAEIMTIEADGMYIMGDGTMESPGVARERARDDAKRAASEKASVYVESLTEVQQGNITEDVIKTISSSVLQIQSSDVVIEVAEGNALIFRCHLVALVDSAQAMNQLKGDGAALEESARRNKELEDQITKVNAELASLKNSYADAKNEAEKERIREQVRINEQKFEANRLMERANDQMRAQDFNAARQTYQEVVSLDPTYSAAYNNLGYICEQSNDIDGAVHNYRKAIENNGNYADAYYNLGNIYYRDKDYRRAIDNYRRTVDINNQFIAAYNNLGLAYANLNEFDKALESFTQAIGNASDRLGRPLAELYNNRGTCYQNMKRFNEALADYDKALELDPDYAEPKLNRDRLSAWLNG